ncbi:MAG: hypothetical protein NTX03_01225 [Bacteroidetes bacterium]|nr:hypothetical protein [Bacteroidota bacterium]
MFRMFWVGDFGWLYMPLKDVGHEWGTKYHDNDSIWAFFDKYRLP